MVRSGGRQRLRRASQPAAGAVPRSPWPSSCTPGLLRAASEEGGQASDFSNVPEISDFLNDPEDFKFLE